MDNLPKPRILFLNRSYWPDSEATGQQLTALCEGLADEFDVHVLAGQPNAASTRSDWQQTNRRNGVTIHRVRHTTLSKRNMMLKAVNFLSFVQACRRQIGQLPQPDVVVFETDPFLLPFVADRFQTRTNCRMVGYLQDIYPDVAVALKPRGRARRRGQPARPHRGVEGREEGVAVLKLGLVNFRQKDLAAAGQGESVDLAAADDEGV